MSPAMKITIAKPASPQDGKGLARQSAHCGLGGATAYNPSSGTFHALESLNSVSEAGTLNGRFKSIDEMDDTASSHGGGADVECMSINESCSGDSEDQPHSISKDKLSLAQPGLSCTDSKRGKIRGKNERKHRRQKERRAQELRDKCNGFIMSHKLKGLSQILVGMGFPNEQATMALTVNNGHVEQSIAWLLDGGEEQLLKDWSSSGNLKLDISEELTQLLEIERKYTFSRPDIERAVVSCEGDLGKVLDLLQAGSVFAVTENEHKSVFSGCPIASYPKDLDVMQPSHQPTNVLGSAYSRRVDADSSVVKGEIRKNSSAERQAEPKSLRRGFDQRAISQSGRMKVDTCTFMPVSSAETGLVFGFGTPDFRYLSNFTSDVVVKEPAHEKHGGSLWQEPRAISVPTRVISAPKTIPNTISTATSSSKCSHKATVEVGSPSSVLHVHDDMRMKGLLTYKHSGGRSELGPDDLADGINSILAIQMQSEGSSLNGSRRGLSYDFASPLSSALSAFQSGSPSRRSYGLFTGWCRGDQQSSAAEWGTGAIRNYDYRNIDWSMNVIPQCGVQGSSNEVPPSMHHMNQRYQIDFAGSRRYQTCVRNSSCSSDQTISGAKIHDYASKDPRYSGFQDWTSPFTGKDLFDLPSSVSSPFL